MNLLELQRKMCEAVMQPLTPSEGMRARMRNGKSARKLAQEIIKPNDRLTSFERLELYNRQYWFRILASFNEDFPGLRAVIGNRPFDALAEAYLIANPSRSFTLRNLGRALESWLRSNPGYLPVATGVLALDMVRLEWAEIEAFDGAEESPLTPDDLKGLGHDSQFTVQPYIKLLDLSYPVDDLLISIRKQEDLDGAAASNALAARKQRAHLKSVGWTKPERTFLAVHRLDFSVYFKRMDREAFLMLTALREGKTLPEAAELAFHGSDLPEEEHIALIQGWFLDWSRWGWFCSQNHYTRNASA
jgi:hypothetical protein